MNPQQGAAVGFDPQGAVLVLAGAGSGKTTVLTRRVAYLLEHFPNGGILALTFTKDAAREMETRLRSLLGENASTVSFPTIGTFHSFAWGLVRSGFQGEPNWTRLGFSACPALLETDGISAWLKAAKKELALQESPEILAEWIKDPFAIVSGSPLPCPSQCPQSPREDLREKFRRHLLESGRVAFDDMVPLAIRLLTGNPEVRADVRTRYRHILVDEFQDTSRDQLELVKLLTADAPSLFLVGDDDQAIYGFRGADPGNINAALGHFPGLRVIKLETNYRSSAAIVAYANAVFRDKPAALRKRLQAGAPRGSAPVRIVSHRSGAEQAGWMMAEMQRLRREEGLAWGDMAVLFRLNVLEPYYRSMLARMGGEDAAREVILSTVHASKGLEYPAVFFAGLEDGILPYRRGKEPLQPERLAEERRIFYVGVTRAQRFLYLCSCRRRILRGKTVEAEASPFLRAARAGMGARWFRAGGPAGIFARGADGLAGAYRAFRGKKGEQ
ncbi:MAG: UvrD/REP helicase domain protein/acyltransferase domain protein [Fibrobacteres bacterium]|nr:UvrD/REP helicase domain protein/acyltransferase domain protein [Fibrobacterota bacterium]